MKCETFRFDEVTINFDKMRVPLSGKQRSKRQGCYRYYGAQGIIDFVDDYIFDGTYLLIAEDGENLKSKKQNIAQVVKGKFWVNNHAHIVQTNEQCNLFYLCYLINNMDLSGYITGSAQPKLSQTNLNAVIFQLPSIEKQNKIVSVLSAFDDKIECNNKINENLQQQAQAVYHEWFDDVGDTTENGILSDICAYSIEKVDVTELNVNTYFSTENMLSDKAGAIAASKLPSTLQTTACHRGDTLISNIRPYFKKIVYCYEKCGCSSDVLCFVPIHPEYSAYLYSTLYDDRFFNFMVAGSKGTKMPRGDKKQIMTFPVKIPTDSELERFNSLAIPILEQIQNNREENKRLSLLRDTLLPKLMNGEVSL